ncbi:unnamed protein product [Effrenium voratum]|nr:unnamed protein product [Effrenium voratum]
MVLEDTRRERCEERNRDQERPYASRLRARSGREESPAFRRSVRERSRSRRGRIERGSRQDGRPRRSKDSRAEGLRDEGRRSRRGGDRGQGRAERNGRRTSHCAESPRPRRQDSRARRRSEGPSDSQGRAKMPKVSGTSEAKEQQQDNRLNLDNRDGFSVGQLVKARYQSGSFFTAKIEAFLENGRVIIEWADGDPSDRTKLQEELRREEQAETQTEQRPDPENSQSPSQEAALTPAEIEQAERIREFQRRRQQGQLPAQEEPPAEPQQNEVQAEALSDGDRAKLEEKLRVLRAQYLKLHEQISAETEATEKQMQQLMTGGASQTALMTFRMDIMSKQSGQRIAALQIQEQITDLQEKLHPGSALRSNESTHREQDEGPKPSLQEPCGRDESLLARCEKTANLQTKEQKPELEKSEQFFSPIQWRAMLCRGQTAGPVVAPAKLGGDQWEKPRQAIGLSLLGEQVASEKLLYLLQDDRRRSYVGYLPSSLDVRTREDFFRTIRSRTAWSQHGQRESAWLVRKRRCSCFFTCEKVRLEPQEYPNWMIQLLELVMPRCGVSKDHWPCACHVSYHPDGIMFPGWQDDDVLFQGSEKDVCAISMTLNLGVAQQLELRANWPEQGEEATQIQLCDGDLVTLEGMVQKHYSLVPQDACRACVNLTWRWMLRHRPGCPAKR